MKIHIVCTTNGCLNEGMNNIEAHFSAYFKKENEVTESGLRDIVSLVKHVRKSDAVLFFTRGTEKTYHLIKAASLLNKHIFLFVVQKPKEIFLKLTKKHPLKCSYFFLDESDIRDVRVCAGYDKVKMNVGIDINKFTPVSDAESRTLKGSYGFDPDKPLVVHVGHLSAGRGLEDFLKIDGKRYNRFIADSGIFEAAELKAKLKSAGVIIKSGFIEKIEDVYGMADVYFFPTKSEDYVISVPLSVMESLSCGTPAVAYASFTKTSSIGVNSENAITYIKDGETPDSAISKAIGGKQNKSYLANVKSWDSAAKNVYSTIRDSIEL